MTTKQCVQSSDKVRCIVHYDHIKFNKDKVIPLVERTFSVLKESKVIRTRLGGDNEHREQCSTIGDVLASGMGYHSACYKKFTFAITLLKRKNLSLSSPTVKVNAERIQRSNETDSAGRFPLECMICKKVKLSYHINGRAYTENKATKLTLKSAEKKFKLAAKMKKDVLMLAVTDNVDLLVKDFRKHSKCFRDYTRIVTNYSRLKRRPGYSDRFSSVTEIIEREVLREGKCVSLDNLLQIQTKPLDKNNRKFLKFRLKRRYGDKLLYLTSDHKSSQLICSSSTLLDMKKGHESNIDSFPFSDKAIIKKAAEILKNILTDYISKADELPWPPTPDSLKSRLEKTPDLVRLFLKSLIHPTESHHIVPENTNRLIDSLVQDLVFAISKGKFLTFKHTCIGLGLHSLTGQKLPILILSRFGHSIPYSTIQEIETAQAELAQDLRDKQKSLPLQPISSSTMVPTIFWWDNFDRFVDNLSGAGSIHNTPGIAFQVETLTCKRREQDLTVTKSNRRSLQMPQNCTNKRPKINPKTCPPKIQSTHQNEILNENQCLGKQYVYLWRIQRRQNSLDQLYSRFPGWAIKSLLDTEKKPTVLTYLPPIQTPITDYGTIFEIFHQSEQYAKQSNMKYTHITFDCGAIMKAYHVIWNNPAKFSNIFLHLGDFHCMKAFFGVIGCYITGSGFEDIIYQSGLCQPGTIRSVLEGKHYNRAFLLHESLAEVISRIFQDFIQFKVTAGDKIDVSDIDNGLSDSTSALYIAKYSAEFKNGLSGAHGETAAYWLKYVDLVDSLHSLHYSLLANDFETRLAAWKELLPLFFYFDRTHYARYGTYYINSLENMELTHPGAKDELIKSGISVRRNKFGIGQAVDLAGEQTYMRNAKTSGGITQFQTRPGAVLKWVLNRPFQTEFVDALKESSGLDKTSTNPRKCLRPSEIMKSERIVTLLQSIIMNQFLSPFDSRLSKDQLFNIVSGKAVDTTILSSLKNSYINGNKALETFLLRLNQHGSASFFDPIARNKPKTFLDEKLKLKVKDASSKSEITVHRDVLGTLLAISNKCKKTVDIDKALKYPLSPVSAPLATCDGSIRKNAKSALLKSALSNLEEIDDNAIPSECDVYMIDLAAYVRTVIARCRTIRDIATELMKSIPHQFTTTYVVADSYEPNSIKSGCRQKRGSGTHYILNSPDMLVPYNVEEFLAVGENKETLFDLILRSICENPPRNKVLYFCSRQCTKYTRKYSKREKESHFIKVKNSKNRKSSHHN